MGPSAIQALLAQHNIAPNAVLGQNFLTDPRVVEYLMEAAGLTANDTVLEVGGGIGTITRALAERAKRVVTVEKDKSLIPILQQAVLAHANVEVVEGDILQPTTYSPPPIPYHLIGNPPYYLTGRLFRTFLEDPTRRPASITVIIQKEVAEKITQKPPRMNLLALSVQIFGKPTLVRTIPRNAFWPEPGVQSALLHVDVYKEPRVPEEQIKQLFGIAKNAFLHGRKQLKNTISPDMLQKAGIDPTRRPQTLTLEEWRLLINRGQTPVMRGLDKSESL